MNEQMKKTRAALAEVQIAIYKDETRLGQMQEDLGDALAGARVGERGAQKRAASLSLDVGKLKSRLEELRGEKSALQRRVDSLQLEQDASDAEAVRERIRALKKRTAEAEDEFAALIDKAWDVGRELLQLGRQWDAEFRQNGEVVRSEMPVRPKNPIRLTSHTWYQGDRDKILIDGWKNPVRPKAGMPRLRQDGDPLVKTRYPDLLDEGRPRLTIRYPEGAA